MTLNNPVEAFSKEVENVGGGFCAEDEDDAVVEGAAPGAAKEVPVRRADGDVSERVLEVEFREKGAASESTDF